MSSLSLVQNPITIDETAPDDFRARLILFGYVLLGTFALALAVSWGNLIDPFVRHDDYPTVFGEAESYYWKTETEGRWLNYWYISLALRLPTEVSFALYLAAWSIFAAAFACYALGARVIVFPGARLLIAWLIVLCPQAFDIAQWFNTVAIGIWVMAIYSLIALFGSRKLAILMLFVFVPLSFSAYNTYPFYLLALLFCRVDHQRSLADLARVVAAFVLSFALAMFLTNTLNWYFHGVFGIAEAEWRSPNYIEGFDDFIENLMKVIRFWQDIFLVYGRGNHALGYMILVVPLLLALVIMREDSLLALYALTPALIGMGILAYYTLTTGVFVPFRATVFLWLVSCFLMVCAVSLMAGTLVRRVALIGMVAALIAYQFSDFRFRFSESQIWQASTRELVTQLPATSQRFVFFGPLAQLKGAREAGIQTFDGLAYRIRFLTGKPTISCRQVDVDCSVETPPFDPRPRYESTLIETVDGVTYIRLPALDFAP